MLTISLCIHISVKKIQTQFGLLMGPRLWLCTSRQDSQPDTGRLWDRVSLCRSRGAARGRHQRNHLCVLPPSVREIVPSSVRSTLPDIDRAVPKLGWRAGERPREDPDPIRPSLEVGRSPLESRLSSVSRLSTSRGDGGGRMRQRGRSIGNIGIREDAAPPLL